MRDKHPEDRLHILIAQTNSNSFTYDGIDLGGERVTQEIETYIRDLERNGTEIKKLSVVGYSLGGLISRYAIGLLYSNGWFDRLQPVNFTTFATPHLGVRTPMLGINGKLWNTLGARTLSASGRQLFTIDKFRNTDRQLLSVLADPSSIFMIALSLFRNRVLYANIINDRSAPYYTTSISTTDPYTDLDAISIHYLPEYSPNIINPSSPLTSKATDKRPASLTRFASSSQVIMTRLPLYALLFVLIPIGSLLFLVNSGVQSVRSQKRIRLHEAGKAGIGLRSYRIPLIVENARSTMEGAFANMNAGRGQEYLPAAESEKRFSLENAQQRENGHEEKSANAERTEPAAQQQAAFPTLALTPQQFAMVRALDNVGFRKYRVHIRQVRHTHAAIIVRTPKKSFDEGKNVVRHWLDEEFEI